MTEFQSLPPQQIKRSRRTRVIRGFVASLIFLFVLSELVSRFYFGLGDPPLFIADSKIEYLCKPGMYHRFGNHYSINQYSMRSGPITMTKTDPSELRVLVIGDSVINGGGLTDDSQLATALLQERLHAALKRPVYVGNISAGSWGPPNELAYLEKFGLFDADCLVVVVSSHDYADAPTFEPVVGVHPSYPAHGPVLAVQEMMVRYLLPRIMHSHEAPDPGTVVAKTPDRKDVEWCKESTREMIRLARAHGMGIIVVQHLEQEELAPGAPEHIGHIELGEAARDEHVEPVQLGPAFKQAIADGRHPYRDDIHPNVEGQKVMADALYPYLYQELMARQSKPAGAATVAATQPAI